MIKEERLIQFRCFGLLFVAGLVCYFNSFFNQFVWDDKLIISPNEYIKDWRLVLNLFATDVHHFAVDKSNFYRPLQMLSYAFDYSLWQLNPMGYHITNALLHILTACIFFTLIQTIIAKFDSLKNQSTIIALATALIWLVHPIHTQATTYASGRADVLVALFILLTLLSYIQKRQKISFLFYILAMLSKELGVMAPLFILLYEGVMPKERGQSESNVGRAFKKLFPYMIIFGVYVALRLSVLNFPTAFTTEKIPSLLPRLLTSARAVSLLIESMLFPVHLSMIRNISFESSLLNIGFILSALGILISWGIALYCRKRNPLITFAIAWFYLAYLPVANIIPMNANVSEHWMYVPSMGFILLMVLVIHHVLMNNRKVFVSIILIISILYGWRLIIRNSDFKDEITFYQRTLKSAPNNVRIVYNLGTAYAFANDYQQAIPLLEKAIQLNPNYAEAYGNLGLIWANQGDLKRAITFHEKAKSLKTGLMENHVNLGNAYANTGQSQKAVAEFKTALEINPNHLGALNGLGIEHGKAKQFSEAEAYFKKVLEIDPRDQAAQNNLEFLYKLMAAHNQ